MTYLVTHFGMVKLQAVLEASLVVNGFIGTLTSFENWQSSICRAPIFKLPLFVWKLGVRVGIAIELTRH